MRIYRTLGALDAGEVVEIEGCKFVKDSGPIQTDDFYIAERNTGPKLLTASSFYRYLGHGDSEKVSSSEVASWIVPHERAYSYDVGECVKVREV